MFNKEICGMCGKRPAAVFITKIDEKGNQINQGICLLCAKNLGLKPVDQFLNQMGLNEDELESLNDEMFGMMETLSQNDEDSNEDTNANLDKKESRTNTPNIFDFLRGLPFDRKANQLSNVDGELTEPNKIETDKKNDKKVKEKHKDNKKYLSVYGINLNDKAAEGLIDNIVGRDNEIERVIQILNRRTKNNPVLIGEPGVGKTAIAEGLASKIVAGTAPYKLRNTQVYLLDLTAMVAGTQFRGQFESRMKGVIDEVKKEGNIILVIDELHNIMGAGEAEGAMNAANILKPALSRGEIQVIGATTLNEYRRHIEKDGALERRFQPVYVNESTVEQTIEILKGIKHYYEDYHKVRISDFIIEDAAKMSERYITDRYLPDKAIDVIDEACSRVNLRNTVIYELEKLRQELIENNTKQENLASKDDVAAYKEIADLKIRDIKISDKIEALQGKEFIDLEVNDIAMVIENWTGIPVKTISEEEAEKLLNLEDRLKARVIGQDKAVIAVSKAIRRNRSGFRKRYKPSSFIFVGPTGVGKTELVKSLAIELFGNSDSLVRLDMSEYAEKHTISKLIGSPPGYVGYDDAGQLTEKIRRRPYSVVLLDEIEKAHADIFNMLLQILDDGRLTDSQGRTVNFENTIIIMTSNAGSSLNSAGIGFINDAKAAVEDHADKSLKSIFRPEFLNRIDDIIVFHKLEKEHLNKIARLMLNDVVRDTSEKGIELFVDDLVVEYIVDNGYDEKYGARPLRRLIQKTIEDELSEMHLKGLLKKCKKVRVLLNDNKIKVIPDTNSI